MIARFLKNLRSPEWKKPCDVKNFVWSPVAMEAFSNWSHNKRAEIDDLPLSWLFQGTMLGADLWESIDHWWNRYPTHFGMFWAIVQTQPRQKWSQAALRTLANHVPVDEVEQLVQSALLCDDGRAWILASEEYSPYLRNITTEQIQQWIGATTYSMQSLFSTFDSLVHLQRCLQESSKKTLIPATLAWHFQQQEHIDPSSNTGKAWHLITPVLDKWMNDDKQLPFWFDPVNKESWLAQCREWIKATGYSCNENSPLFPILRTLDS